MKRISAIFLLLGLCIAGPLSAQQAQVVDKIIAKVNNYIILKSDLDKAYLEIKSNPQYGGNVTECEVLEQLVVSKLMVAKADIDSVTVTDAEVQLDMDRRFDIILAQVGEESKLVELYGKTADQLKAELFDDIRERKIEQRMRGEITKDVTVTPSDVRKFFNSIPKDSIPYFSAEVSVSQIVKRPEPGPAEKEKTRQFLLDLKQRILNGEDFGRLASQYSQDPGSARYGGDLGYVNRGDFVPEFEAVAFTLEPGELSGAVESEYGYHLIQLIERRGNTFNARHILLRPEPSEADIVKAERFLDSLRTLIVADSLDFAKAAKDNSDDAMSKETGGFFIDPTTNSNRVSMKQLDPVLFFTIDSMKVGSVTKPIRFKSEQGEDLVRIIYYKSRMRPHQANLDDDYEKIRVSALSKKQNERVKQWFREAKNEVFIEIDPQYKNCTMLTID
ncbi:peptidylprolyl isomerase [Penaeicola halotolerans]|uniref:peptidylprolyl isomerase n=1 Tax=Penaeicola halotolerans TaxID=2793196 RepID=UPI001CF85AD7|nr:peptidylprolyl isomerase [Penaeicola halotolerans]